MSKKVVIDEIKKVNSSFEDWDNVEITVNESLTSAVVTSKDDKVYWNQVEIKINLTQDLSKIISIDPSSFTKANLLIEKIQNLVKEQNSNLDWDKIDINVQINNNDVIIKITSKNKKTYVNEFKTKITVEDQLEGNVNQHVKNSVRILLWILAAINIIGIFITSIFVRNKKKEEE